MVSLWKNIYAASKTHPIFGIYVSIFPDLVLLFFWVYSKGPLFSYILGIIATSLIDHNVFLTPPLFEKTKNFRCRYFIIFSKKMSFKISQVRFLKTHQTTCLNSIVFFYLHNNSAILKPKFQNEAHIFYINKITEHLVPKKIIITKTLRLLRVKITFIKIASNSKQYR